MSAFGDAPIRCLNIGSGPRSIVGQKTVSPSLEVVNVDPLAPAYNALMSFLDAPGGGDIVFGAVEVIDEIDLGKFQFISAQNCLDHAYDVPEGLERLINVLDDRGVIKLEHYLNEAVAQNYLGFHKWNIEIVDGKIHMWSKTESHKFDHEARGFALKYEERAVKKGSGADHTMLTIHLERGL